ncbi:Glycogen phosphorylase [Granulibacter bethesdensis]|uniref:glycogen/starch/alpha-glucan phosphorylase n=1 Tax=Granulibacter bethesdensis TaxID=364410 RepID=UPI00090BAD3E|nr:glycogen/starch/alpha-glucan phosphorylase [Granulibacter bethesdensis]APH58258.1 Glycogen phosphorylase [Granulibacter bethesdensis]
MDAANTPYTAQVAELHRAIEDKMRYAVGRDPRHARLHDWYAATALAVRDRIVDRWHATARSADEANAKRVYYLSLEFLIGRLLTDSLTNLNLMSAAKEALALHGVSFDQIKDLEPDAALGNGGLGRLAACFMESMATVGLAGLGYGIRYDHGLFRQVIRDGYQVEMPEDWLVFGNPWEFERPEIAYDIGFGGRVLPQDQPDGSSRLVWMPAERVRAVAYDTPVVGWQGTHINTLRLWRARSVEPMRLDAFNRGHHADAFAAQLNATNISRVLYPDDSSEAGRELRLKQEFFFTSASLQDLVRRHMAQQGSVERLPDTASIQLNDTHPAVAVAELVRLLVDEYGLTLERAFSIARGTLGYTNHTLLPEALESWPVTLFERLLPRHMQIIYEINALHLDTATPRPVSSPELRRSISLIDESNGRQVRMGHLAFVGSKKVNGVSALHGDLMKTTVFRDFHRLFPDRITAITNGITFRRWLVECNPGLTALINDSIGNRWVADAEELSELARFVDDTPFMDRYSAVKRENKQRLAALVQDRMGIRLDPDALFDVQIKRIHEYKRQLLNLIETVALYDKMRAEPGRNWTPRVKIFAGKAAASYHRAKLIIKLANDIARVVNNDPVVRDRLRVVFLPNYNVSLAEVIIPAADLSEQISTAGLEASGTGNMKMALNGALTIGTLDGANIEIHDHVGDDNILIFGLRADEVADIKASGYDARAKVAACPSLAQAIEAIRSGVFSPDDPSRYAGLIDHLLNDDVFLVTADFESYEETHKRGAALYRTPLEWRRKALLNTAAMGWFSSDRTIREYARDIWHAAPHPSP